MERDKEYDAFGPWIYEIENEYEVPRIFREYYNVYDKPLILFKVPRNIERRNASPNMDLYDYLVGAYDTYLRILKRIGKSVIEKKINYSTILAIKDVHALLKGELVFFTEDELVKVDYNTVSEDIIIKLINIIGQKMGIAKRHIQLESIPIEYIPNNEDSLDFLFVNLTNRLKQINPDINLVAYQPRIYLNRATTELIKQLKRYMFSKSAFLTSEKELIILEREVSKRRKGREGLAYSYLYLPFQSITEARINYLDNAQSLCSMELIARNQSFTYIFKNNNGKIFDLYYKLNEIHQNQ